MVKLLNYHLIPSDTLTGIALSDGSFYTSSKTTKKGSWYFEYTHHSGGHQNVIGFRSMTNDLELTITREKSNEVSMFFYANSNSFLDLKMNVMNDGYIAGIGFDIDSNTFFFRINEEMRTLNISEYIQKDENVWNIVVRQRTDSKTTDIVDVNFGASPFNYVVPFHFTPWEFNPKIFTCNHLSVSFLLLRKTYILIIISI